MKIITVLLVSIVLAGCSATQTKPEPVEPIELENVEQKESIEVPAGRKVTITIVIE